MMREYLSSQSEVAEGWPGGDWTKLTLTFQIPPGEMQSVIDSLRCKDAMTFGRGLGLGLSIVRGLIRGLGGTTVARNAPGGGAEFIVKIPVSTADQIPDTL